MQTGSPAFFRLLANPVKFRLFLLSKLPSAYFSGIRVLNANASGCSVSVPFKWFTRNPFRSTYFACLAMAAEMSTGVLAMAQVYGRKPSVSMLVTGLEARYYKKATGVTVFTCEDGDGIRNAVETTVATGEGQTIRARSTGRDVNGETVAEFFVTWSFKSKRS
jgi:hypothetical protein